jgi:uridylate kinase
MKKPPKRMLIKFSGEFLRTSPEDAFSADAVQRLVKVLSLAQSDDIEFGIVVGAGNLFRGIKSVETGVDRIVGDHVGMLGTMMNALVLKEALLRGGITAHVMAPTPTVSSIKPYDPFLARALIAKKEPVIFAGGTGNPYFTTDSAATLRALEIGADVLVKSTKVSGVYSDDPIKNPNAIRYTHITFEEVLQAHLKIMDHTAIALAMEHKLSIFVYKFGDPISIREALLSKDAGTYIST